MNTNVMYAYVHVILCVYSVYFEGIICACSLHVTVHVLMIYT